MSQEQTSSNLTPCNVEKFLTQIRMKRDLEDRIIYRLNEALRTTSMSSRKDSGKNVDSCHGLKSLLDEGRSQRESEIRNCLASHEVAIGNYKEKLAAGESGFRRVVYGLGGFEWVVGIFWKWRDF